jgi:radical SAM superfamily enzyme YgiQ (UPF0313 family)
MTLIDVTKTIAIIKSINKNIRVVLGGPHVHLFPDETINLKNVDFLVLGEGEVVFKDLLDNIEDLSVLKKIPGLVFKEDGKIVNTVVTTIFTSRGCPFKCSFCDRPHLGKAFRARSAMNVVDEIEECVKIGINEFLFYDDTFTVNKKRVLDICNEIVSRRLDIGWDIRARVDTVDEEILQHLKKAGCQGIHYGIEAGTEKILKILNKGITISKARQVFDLTRRYNIPVLAYFMIGSPTETKEDIFSTFEVMKALKPDYVHMTILTPFPGTKIYLDGLKNGNIEHDCWRKFAEDPTPDFIPPIWGETFTREELNDLLTEGYRKFYLRPSYILKRIVKVRSFNELKKKTIAGIKVFLMKVSADKKSKY